MAPHFLFLLFCSIHPPGLCVQSNIYRVLGFTFTGVFMSQSCDFGKQKDSEFRPFIVQLCFYFYFFLKIPPTYLKPSMSVGSWLTPRWVQMRSGGKMIFQCRPCPKIRPQPSGTMSQRRSWHVMTVICGES